MIELCLIIACVCISYFQTASMVDCSVNRCVEPEHNSFPFLTSKATASFDARAIQHHSLLQEHMRPRQRPQFDTGDMTMEFLGAACRPACLCIEEFLGDVDALALARYEARLDAEGGWDSRNEDTFGASSLSHLQVWPPARPAGALAHGAVGLRRPYRWWRQRACLDENLSWGKRSQPWDGRMARASSDNEVKLRYELARLQTNTVSEATAAAEAQDGEQRKANRKAARAEQVQRRLAQEAALIAARPLRMPRAALSPQWRPRELPPDRFHQQSSSDGTAPPTKGKSSRRLSLEAAFAQRRLASDGRDPRSGAPMLGRQHNVKSRCNPGISHAPVGGKPSLRLGQRGRATTLAPHKHPHTSPWQGCCHRARRNLVQLGIPALTLRQRRVKHPRSAQSGHRGKRKSSGLARGFVNLLPVLVVAAMMAPPVQVSDVASGPGFHCPCAVQTGARRIADHAIKRCSAWPRRALCTLASAAMLASCFIWGSSALEEPLLAMPVTHSAATSTARILSTPVHFASCRRCTTRTVSVTMKLLGAGCGRPSSKTIAAAIVCLHIGAFAVCLTALSQLFQSAYLAAPPAYALALACSRLGPAIHFQNCRLWTMSAVVSIFLLSGGGPGLPALAAATISACPKRFLWWPAGVHHNGEMIRPVDEGTVRPFANDVRSWQKQMKTHRAPTQKKNAKPPESKLAKRLSKILTNIGKQGISPEAEGLLRQIPGIDSVMVTATRESAAHSLARETAEWQRHIGSDKIPSRAVDASDTERRLALRWCNILPAYREGSLTEDDAQAFENTPGFHLRLAAYRGTAAGCLVRETTEWQRHTGVERIPSKAADVSETERSLARRWFDVLSAYKAGSLSEDDVQAVQNTSGFHLRFEAYKGSAAYSLARDTTEWQRHTGSQKMPSEAAQANDAERRLAQR